MSRRKRRKLPGHYCWCCDSRRPNERFSGKGHARHVCRECAKLPIEQRNYRQALRNLESCLTWEGHVWRKQWKNFQRFLAHDDARIRSIAEEIERDQQEFPWRAREVFEEALYEVLCGDDAPGVNSQAPLDDAEALDEVPF